MRAKLLDSGKATERDFAEAPRDPRVEALSCEHHVQQERPDGQVDDRDSEQRDEVVGQPQRADVSSRDPERDTGGRGRHGERSGAEEQVDRRANPRDRSRKHSGGRYEGGDPGAEEQQRGDLNSCGQVEELRLDGFARALPARLFEELDDDRGCEEERQRRPGRVERLPGADGDRDEPEQDRAEDSARRPHPISIGRLRHPA